MATQSSFFGSYGPRAAGIRKDPPLKGSFPFDLERACKLPMLDYMLCMNRQRNHNELCRPFAADYFRCRMDKGLMAEEPMENLGYADMPEISDEEKQMLLTNVRPPGKPSVEEALKSALSSRPPKK